MPKKPPQNEFKTKEVLQREHAEIMKKIYLSATYVGKMKDKDYTELTNRLFEEKRKIEAQLSLYE